MARAHILPTGLAAMLLVAGAVAPASAGPEANPRLDTPDQAEYAGFSVPVDESPKITGVFVVPDLGDCDARGDEGAFIGFELVDDVGNWVKSGVYSYCLDGVDHRVASFGRRWFRNHTLFPSGPTWRIRAGDRIRVTVTDHDGDLDARIGVPGRWLTGDHFVGFEPSHAIALYVPMTVDGVALPVLSPKPVSVSGVRVGGVDLGLLDPTKHVLSQGGVDLVVPSEITDGHRYKYNAVG